MKTKLCIILTFFINIGFCFAKELTGNDYLEAYRACSPNFTNEQLGRLAQVNEPNALMALASSCCYGTRGIEKNTVMAELLLNRVIEIYKPLALKGYTDAQCDLALVWQLKSELNLGSKANNTTQAFKLMSSAAAKNNVRAMLLLGEYYIKGYGTQKDLNKGLELIQKSAKRGYAEAQASLGFYYHDKEKNPKKAFPILLKAAQKGHPMAQLYMGICYLRGEAVERNKELASYWLRKSSYQGNVLSTVLLIDSLK